MENIISKTVELMQVEDTISRIVVEQISGPLLYFNIIACFYLHIEQDRGASPGRSLTGLKFRRVFTALAYRSIVRNKYLHMS